MKGHCVGRLADGDVAGVQGGRALVVSEPRWSDEPDGRQTARAEQSKAALDALPCLVVAEREKLGLVIGAAEGAQLVGPPSMRAVLVVPLAVKKDLGPRPVRPGLAVAEPIDEHAILGKGPLSMPVGDDQ